MMTLAQAANIVHGKRYGADARFTAVVADSRTIERGGLFVAIPGEKFDGHDFVVQAHKQGAVAALVSRAHDSALPQIVVRDTTQALGQLASHWRLRFDIPLLAITGSNGKTTVTAMAASILNQRGNCLFPERSFNNQWGVPLTLLKLNERHDFAVIEMGTNHIGEIAALSRMAKPTIALINNVAAAHLEGLDNLQQIAQAKAEIFCGLNETGTAVINADDQFAAEWRNEVAPKLKSGRVLSFAMPKQDDLTPADLTLANLQCEWRSSRFELCIRAARPHKQHDQKHDQKHDERQATIHLPLPGRHNVMNALAAAAICHAVGATMQCIKRGLENMRAVQGRLNHQRALGGAVVLDDSYNANPQSVKAGIDVLARFKGRKILVLGAMAELGAMSAQLHHEVGRYANDQRIDLLLCLLAEEAGQSHNDAKHYARGFGQGGKRAQVFQSLHDLVAELKGNLSADVAVLVKGSRSAMMERVVAEIIEVEELSGDDEQPHRGGASC